MTTPPDPRPPTSRAGHLRRSEEDRYLGGVAGGLAERLSTDPVLVRIGLVGLALYLAYADDVARHGLVLVPYALLWATLPTASGRHPLIVRLRDQDARRELLLAAVVVVLGLVLPNRPGSVVVLALAALAVGLLRDPPPTAAEPDNVEEAHTVRTSRPSRRFVPWPSRPASTPRPRREPALWPLTLGLVVFVFMVALAMDVATDGGVDPRIVIDVALLVVGAVLVLSGWRGRARITVVALAALVPLWVATSVADVGRFSGEGTLRVQPTALPATSPGEPGPSLSYEVGYGTLDVDLRQLPLDDGEVVTVAVGVTAGAATVAVPADVAVRVRGEVGVGTLHVQAPAHHLSDGEPALHRRFDRSYPAVGVDCYDATVSEDELADLAQRAGIRPTGSAGTPLPAKKLAAAIGAAGYPQPTVSHAETPPDFGNGIVYDESGNPATTTSLADAEPPEVVTYWNVQVGTTDFALCQPSPPPDNPPTVIIEPTIGLGSLEIERA